MLVTNRHVVADQKTVKIYLPSGHTSAAIVVPSGYSGDLVLIQAELDDGPIAELSNSLEGDLFTVGLDQRAGQIKAYKPGKLLIGPDKSYQFSRIHHTAISGPGNSGGALLNSQGKVVGITTSGGSGRSEAIPVKEILALKTLSGQKFSKEHQQFGENYRDCILWTEKLSRNRFLSDSNAQGLKNKCRLTQNRQLLELTAQILGRANRLSTSALFFEQSLERDPSAINARLGYLVTLHLLGRYSDEVKLLEGLMQIIPRNKMVQRFALQVGKILDNQELIEDGLRLIKTHAPENLPAAKRFLKAKIRPGK